MSTAIDPSRREIVLRVRRSIRLWFGVEVVGMLPLIGYFVIMLATYEPPKKMPPGGLGMQVTVTCGRCDADVTGARTDRCPHCGVAFTGVEYVGDGWITVYDRSLLDRMGDDVGIWVAVIGSVTASIGLIGLCQALFLVSKHKIKPGELRAAK